MSWKFILDAIALVLVLEGLWPFISPKKYRHFLIKMITQSDKQLHFTGLFLMVLGVIIAMIVHSY